MQNIVSDNKDIKKVTVVGFVVNVILSVVKVLAGIIGRSGAMVADGVHSLSDSLTDIVVLIGIRYTNQPPDKCHNYGHDKYETLATVIISIFLIVVGVEIIKNGVNGIISVIQGNVLPEPSYIALIAAVASIAVKELLYRYTMHYGKKTSSRMLKANAWHHRSDVLSSMGALVGISGAIFLGNNWTVLDPIASVVVSVFIFKVAYQILKPAIDELMDRALPEEDKNNIIKLIEDSADIMGYHHLRTRSMGRKSLVEVHIFVDSNLTVVKSHAIASELEVSIRGLLNNNTVITTIHIEPYDKDKANQS